MLHGPIGLICLLGLLLFSACRPREKANVDELNQKSYYFHYRSLDSTKLYARQALNIARDNSYDDGQAEALNNLAFVSIARMRYDDARQQLDSIGRLTGNQIELLVCAIQQMRLCQRESRNKEFYEYYEQAKQALNRIDEEKDRLSERQQRRMAYARSELACVVSTYYYYVGLEQNSSDELLRIDTREIESDTAQHLNYLYQVGAGGIIHGKTRQETAQQEWDYLMYCFQLASASGITYWKANSMQAMSEHLSDKEVAQQLMADNLPAMKFINPEHVPDSMLAGYLAEKSLYMFQQYGDVYQVAGSYRTLASCYWALGDYNASGYYLEKALADTAVYQAPDLVASIREKLSLTYSAIDDKLHSDENRTIYIDLQEQTRQDRQLEARADRLALNSKQLNWMIGGVLMMIVLVVSSIFLFDYLRRRKMRRNPIENLLQPLREWEEKNSRYLNNLNERYEEVNETCQLGRLLVENNKRRYVENRAKVFLVNSVTPLIDRMTNEVNCLIDRQETPQTRQARYQYLTELTEKINEYNAVLTEWIQLRQGQLSLKVESFRVQDVFDIVARSRMAFQLKGIDLVVEPTDNVVKADRILTLFMINTMADNAQKFTPRGGRVIVSSHQTDDYVEIAVEDNGEGMDEEQLGELFDHKIHSGHGFGLLNCKGIIEKYRKTSQLFRVCTIQAESQKGKGSRFSFRLPIGVAKAVSALLLSVSALLFATYPTAATAQTTSQEPRLSPDMQEAMILADSTYQCNITNRYGEAIDFANRALAHIYQDVADEYGPDAVRESNGNSTEPLELQWFHQGIDTDYDLIVFLRNEIAVSALALHLWDVYQQNNRIYTLLYKEKSADKQLGEYVQTLQRQETNKTIAVALLIGLLIAIVMAYYLLYERHRIFFRVCFEQVEHINNMLLSDLNAEEKLAALDEQLARFNMPQQLQDIVMQIREALQRAVETERDQQLSIELAEDELRRTEYEDLKLHISNNVLDNCLSTLKHETMYYPSRIGQLIDGTDQHLQAIRELLAYYKELYTILSAQAMRQVEGIRPACRKIEIAQIIGSEADGVIVRGDDVMLRYLFELLKRQSGQKQLSPVVETADDRYVRVLLTMPSLPYRDFFVPSMQNIPLLICRQILRDNSESTNLRGCGIVADRADDGSTIFRITLAKGTNELSRHTAITK